MAQHCADVISARNVFASYIWGSGKLRKGHLTRSLWYPGEMAYSIGYDSGVMFKVKNLGLGNRANTNHIDASKMRGRQKENLPRF